MFVVRKSECMAHLAQVVNLHLALLDLGLSVVGVAQRSRDLAREGLGFVAFGGGDAGAHVLVLLLQPGVLLLGGFGGRLHEAGVLRVFDDVILLG